MANAALFYGCVLALPAREGDVGRRVPFAEARAGFLHAAQHGLDAHVAWLSGQVPARELLLSELLPMAHEGLSATGVPDVDRERYLGVVEERVRSGRTAARWILEAVEDGPAPARALRARAVVRAMMDRQASGEPVHRWPAVPASAPASRTVTVGEVMTTDLFTVRPEDVVDLATSVMSWKHVRHVPVESATGHVVGLVSHRALLRLRERQLAGPDEGPVAVADIMNAATTADRDLPLDEAIARLLEADAGCLLVLDDGKLAGIVTERDLLRALARCLG